MENENQTSMFGGKLLVKEVTENSDGSATVVFEADKDFQNGFKKYYNLKRWSQKKFNQFMNEAILSSVKYYQEQEKKNKENHEHKNNQS